MEEHEQGDSNLSAYIMGALIIGATIGGLVAGGPIGAIIAGGALLGGCFIGVGAGELLGLMPVTSTNGEEDS